jgi:hypothetical protein
LVERLNGIEEVTGSNPVGSTTLIISWAATAKAGNSTGTLTQPAFNDQHGLIPDRLSDTNYTHSQSPLLFFFRKSHPDCLSGAALEFLYRALPDIQNPSVVTIRHRQFTKSSFVADYNERK